MGNIAHMGYTTTARGDTMDIKSGLKMISTKEYKVRLQKNNATPLPSAKALIIFSSCI